MIKISFDWHKQLRLMLLMILRRSVEIICKLGYPGRLGRISQEGNRLIEDYRGDFLRRYRSLSCLGGFGLGRKGAELIAEKRKLALQREILARVLDRTLRLVFWFGEGGGL